METQAAHILLVEDDPRIAYQVRKATVDAEPGRFQLLHVARLSEAISRLCVQPFDVVLLDLALEDSQGPDGVTLVHAVAPQVPVMALVSMFDEGRAQESLRRGAQDYVIKEHLDRNLFRYRVLQLVSRHHATAAPFRPAALPESAAPEAACPTYLLPEVFQGCVAPGRLLQPGDRLGGYAIERLLGGGGMGMVYLSLQCSLGRKVAVKVVNDRFSKDPKCVQRFDREATALANMSHPNIVTIFDKGVHNGRYYIVMEYVDGICLRELLDRERMEPAHALHIAMVLCDALDYAHALGIVHRDIKPENLLFTKLWQAKVTDFGLARLTQAEPPLSGTLTYTGTVLGTKDYMAPEARSSVRRADVPADIYSLGVVLYEMLTGRLPIGKFEPPSSIVSVDPRIDGVISRTLEADCAKRYQSASDLSCDLAPIVRSSMEAESQKAPLRLRRSVQSVIAGRGQGAEAQFPGPASFRASAGQ